MNDQIQALGGTLVAVSPSTRENAAAIADKAKLGFDILSDPGNRYAEKLGLVYKLTNLDRGSQFVPGVDPKNPLQLRA